MAQNANLVEHWSNLYASPVYDWHRSKIDGRTAYYRRQGIVENLFDIDGIDFEGRADLNINVHIKYKTALTNSQLQARILLVWAFMRQRHLLLSTRSLYRAAFQQDGSGRQWLDKYFLYLLPRSYDEALTEAQQSIDFVADTYDDVDVSDFYLHLTNTARVIDEKQSLSRLFVLLPKSHTEQTSSLHLILVAGHQIADGLTVFRWANHLIDLMNWSEAALNKELHAICSTNNIPASRLPPAQEALYPVRSQNIALARWKWVITRILRHVQRPAPESFQNPLRRERELTVASSIPPTYARLLDYERKPPLSAFCTSTDLCQRATHNLIRLCREAKISIGSGSFTLVGIVMMRLEEIRNPDISLNQRLPFVGSFPLNPRPFLSGTPTTGKENSLMLAFSEGITLPFMPSHLDLPGTFKVLGRLAHRQLRQYQKRPRNAEEEIHLGLRSPTQLLPAMYLSTLERLDGKVKPEQRVGVNPQGMYPIAKRTTMATCGISSVGDRTSLIASGRYNVSDLGDKDLVADFHDIKSCVRPRDGEFLVGASGTQDQLGFMVSGDGSALDPEKADRWKAMMESILDYDMSVPAQKSLLSSKL